MLFKIAVCLVVVGVASGQQYYRHTAPAIIAPILNSVDHVDPVIKLINKEGEPFAPARYQFKYGVHDTYTHDIKEQEESREGDVVKGHYSLLQPDGRTRIVQYTADKHNGFQAHVQYVGHTLHSPIPAPIERRPLLATPIFNGLTIPVYKLSAYPFLH